MRAPALINLLNKPALNEVIVFLRRYYEPLDFVRAVFIEDKIIKHVLLTFTAIRRIDIRTIKLLVVPFENEEEHTEIGRIVEAEAGLHQYGAFDVGASEFTLYSSCFGCTQVMRQPRVRGLPSGPGTAWPLPSLTTDSSESSMTLKNSFWF